MVDFLKINALAKLILVLLLSEPSLCQFTAPPGKSCVYKGNEGAKSKPPQVVKPSVYEGEATYHSGKYLLAECHAQLGDTGVLQFCVEKYFPPGTSLFMDRFAHQTNYREDTVLDSENKCNRFGQMTLRLGVTPEFQGKTVYCLLGEPTANCTGGDPNSVNITKFSALDSLSSTKPTSGKTTGRLSPGLGTPSGQGGPFVAGMRGGPAIPPGFGITVKVLSATTTAPLFESATRFIIIVPTVVVLILILLVIALSVSKTTRCKKHVEKSEKSQSERPEFSRTEGESLAGTEV